MTLVIQKGPFRANGLALVLFLADDYEQNPQPSKPERQRAVDDHGGLLHLLVIRRRMPCGTIFIPCRGGYLELSAAINDAGFITESKSNT
jgi:hypothetical protein